MSDVLKELCDLLRENKIKVYFWVCPKGCDGRVKWTPDCSDATCEVCGYTRKEWIATLPPPPTMSAEEKE